MHRASVSRLLSKPENSLPLLLFLAHLVIGANLGLSDDEAYYWVLAQRPALGYAFHPPGMSWMIVAARVLFEGFLGPVSVVVVRIPAAFTMAMLLALGLRWIRHATGRSLDALPALGLLSFAGLFSLGWMLVPDTPLFMGWMIAFYSSWRACQPEAGARRWDPWIAFGVAVAMLGKYSGVLVPFSVGLAALFLAPKKRRLPILGWAALGGVLALLPIVIWNARHEWGSLLYQIRDRHDDHEWSLARYSKFWVVSLVAAGPLVIAEFFGLLRLKLVKPLRFVQFFALPPALVYCTQPLWSDFKPHWAWIIWWPATLAFALRLARAEGGASVGARFQIGYAAAISAFIVASCFDPLSMRLLAATKGAAPDPRLDVTNDFYGWAGLERFLAERGVANGLPVLGSRYQTAAQAAFALGSAHRVSRVPRDLKARDEWAIPPAADGFGPAWPRLRAPVVFVTDMRYDAPPEFPGANCSRLGRLETRRGPYLAKWVEVWKCDPV